MTPDLDLFSPKTSCELVPDFFVGTIGRMAGLLSKPRYSVSRLITSHSAFAHGSFAPARSGLIRFSF